VAFVLHSAGTVHPERWRNVTRFVINIVERLDVGADRTRVAVVTWSNMAHIGFTLDQFTARQDIIQVHDRCYPDARNVGGEIDHAKPFNPKFPVVIALEFGHIANANFGRFCLGA